MSALDAPSPKMRLIRDLLALRRDHPALFAHGSYEPAEVTGTDHVLAFERRDGAAVLRCAVALRPTGQATIRFPSGATADHTVFNAGSVWVDIA